MPLPPLVRRRDLARALNADEFDDDIDNLDGRIAALEGAAPEFPIDDITASGDQLTFHLADSTEKTVAMPYRRLNPVTYTAGQAAQIDDAFPFNGSLWVVTWPHTMAAEFDAGANDGGGHNYYFELLPNPGNSLPDGGELGQVLFKLDGTNYHAGWRFLDAVYVTFVPSSDSELPAGNVAETLEALEVMLASAIAGLAFTALQISFSPSSASGLASTNAEDAINELAERVTDFADLSGHISPEQARNAVVALGTSGTVSLDPDLAEVFSITPAGAVTLNAASAAEGANVTVIITTSGTSNFNVTPNTNFKSAGALATGTVSGKTFSITFRGDGSNLVEVARTAAM
jgi:hypothetical protein